jgi:hypothetical protein
MEKEHFEILLEDIKEKVESILEGHSSLNSKIDRNHQEMNEKFGFLDSKIESVNTRLSARIDKLDAKFDSVERKLSNKIDGVAADLAAHRADTESHPKGYKVSD